MRVLAGDQKDLPADPASQDTAVTVQPAVAVGCYMCQIHEALGREEPAAMPAHILTKEQAESSMTTLLCCGSSTYVMWRYRRTRVVRRYIIWLLAAYCLLVLAFCFFVVVVYTL